MQPQIKLQQPQSRPSALAQRSSDAILLVFAIPNWITVFINITTNLRGSMYFRAPNSLEEGGRHLFYPGWETPWWGGTASTRLLSYGLHSRYDPGRDG